MRLPRALGGNHWERVFTQLGHPPAWKNPFSAQTTPSAAMPSPAAGIISRFMRAERSIIVKR